MLNQMNRGILGQLTISLVAFVLASPLLTAQVFTDLQPLAFQNDQLVVDLGVGLYGWPLPMDYDGDGDWDLVLSCSDKPYNGTYVFENPGGDPRQPIFKPARRISRGRYNVQVSWVNGQPRVLTPGAEYPDFLHTGLEHPQQLEAPDQIHQPVGPHSQKLRANLWKYIDYDGDGDQDLTIGIGDWSDYGWDDAYDDEGNWINGPLHGFVYIVINSGSDADPRYDPPRQLVADGQPIDVYGWPSPCLADFDDDGDNDLICGEFLDGLTYFQNIGSRPEPRYAAGHPLESPGGTLHMDLQMILPTAIDWDHDGDFDLVVSDEDGRAALVENLGRTRDGRPLFRDPVYFRQEADLVKCGALSTPCCIDWDGDGDEDILSGNTAGYIEWIENLGPSDDSFIPRWAAPKKLTAEGRIIRVQAGANGSIQGPCEAKWGYTTLTAADWDGDNLPDVMINSIWGRIQWFRNIGSRRVPILAAAQDIRVVWTGTPPKPAWTWWTPDDDQLVTQWRTTPVMVDWNDDGLTDLIMLDHEGFLAYYQRERTAQGLQLLPPRRIFVDANGDPLRLNDRRAGGSGRRKLCVVDWDQDGRKDLLVNGKNADWYRQTSSNQDQVTLVPMGSIADREISSHSTSPTTCDWNQNGIPDLLVGAEDGHFYYLPR